MSNTRNSATMDALGARIVVVGTTGSGKTTLARALAARLNRPHIELDALHWDADWQPAPLPEFRARVTAATQGERWVLDGNYSKTRDIVWERADTLIWLDYNLFTVILPRLLRRGLRRVIWRETLWNGNRETVRQLFFSRESLFLWALRTHYDRRLRHIAALGQPDYAHLRVYHFRNPRECDRWLTTLGIES